MELGILIPFIIICVAGEIAAVKSEVVAFVNITTVIVFNDGCVNWLQITVISW